MKKILQGIIHKQISFQTQIHYDDSFKANTTDINYYLDQMVTHMQTHFCQTSLGTQIKLEVRNFDPFRHVISISVNPILAERWLRDGTR